MPRRKATKMPDSPRRPAAKTMEDRENQMISLAVDLAEQQLMQGTASPSVIVHYLKLGSTREQLEKAKIEKETAMLNAKANALANADDIKNIMTDALEAFKSYSPMGDEDD